MEEHRVIERALDLLQRAADRVGSGDKPAQGDLEKLLDFLRGFADGCHHRKEEGVLFPYLEGHGVPRDLGPIGVMLREHDVGREHVRGMTEALTRDTPEAFTSHALAYIALLRDHIAKEDNVLFPIADQLIDLAEAQGLLERFEEAEEGTSHGRYLALVEELEATL